jgi:TrpR family transcriptional regulator, trp operon repressor
MALRARRPIRLETALARLRSSAEAGALLQVLLSPHEMATLHKRWAVFQMLLNGATQRSVRDEVGVSIATASRAARAVRPAKKLMQALVTRRES